MLTWNSAPSRPGGTVASLVNTLGADITEVFWRSILSPGGSVKPEGKVMPGLVARAS